MLDLLEHVYMLSSDIIIYRPVWYCSICHNQYNHSFIEMMLIEVIQQRSVEMVVQDLKCTKCNGVCFIYRGINFNLSLSACVCVGKGEQYGRLL